MQHIPPDRRRGLRRAVAALVAGAVGVVPVVPWLAAPAAAAPARAVAAATPEDPRVLVFSKTAGFRHDSIDEGIAAIEALGADGGFAVDATEDAGAFTPDNLAQYDAVVWLSTTGDVLDDTQQAAFEGYIRGGGGYAGIHAASDTEYDWPWYGELVGAYFESHPQIQEATVDVLDQVHPSTEPLPQQWVRTDEWYNYRDNPRGDVHVLATLDEDTYQGGADGADHPIAWCQDYDGGRAWYTGGGHTAESYSEPAFLQHLLGGIRTAAGLEAADCGATVDANFEQVTLAKGAEKTGEPIAMAVLPDRRVLHTSRSGTVYLTTPDATTSVAAQVPVYTHDEDGLQGVAIDPDFETNRWVYLYYAPPLDTPSGDAPTTGTGPEAFEPWKGYNQLARFRMTDAGTLDLATKQEILRVPADRGICCHAGGEIDFDAQGNLYLSTGDDTNPFESEGYSPIDERLTRNPAFDAQRSSANTNDLRGKVLRISVQEDGTYTVPEGNLFDEAADAEDKTLPEIYAMGFRNPFRFAVDKATGAIVLGDYGPDAGGPSAFGPGGQVEFAYITEPGNHGWPYCTGDGDAYTDRTFTGAGMGDPAGATFDCAAPVNTSPRNTGLTDLPPSVPAWLPYDGGSVPELGNGSESPMGGPVYQYDADNPSTTKFPAYYDDKAFLYEWGRQWIKTATVGEGGELVEVTDFWPDMVNTQLMNLEFGPDGSLYVLDYGTGFFSGDANSAVYRIDYVKGSRSPVARASASTTSGVAPLTVQFSSEGTADPDPGDTVTYAWDFGDGTTSTEADPSHTYTEDGQYTARLTVTDSTGKTGSASVNIVVGNSAPTVTIELPRQGGIYDYGDSVPVRVTVTDAEDGEVDCSRVRVDTALGHNEHTHGDQQFQGCTGTVTIPAAWEDASEQTFYLVNATYTDEGGPNGAPALTSTAQVVLEHREQQAEWFDAQQGVQVVGHAGAAGGERVGYIDAGDWLRFDDIDLTGIDAFVARTSGGTPGFQLRAGAPDGPVVGTATGSGTGSVDVYVDQAPAPVSDPGGTNDLYVVFTKNDQDLDQLTFEGVGLSGNARPVLTGTATPLTGDVPLTVDFTASATDPEGTAVTYAWDFGDGSAPVTTATAQHVYTAAGRYTATVTATDEAGAVSTRTFEIRATAPAPGCEDETAEVAFDDEFDGSALDGCRWDVSDYDPLALRVTDGALQIDTSDGDVYGADNRTVTNIVTQPQAGTDWTVETKVTIPFVMCCQQAGLIVHQDAANYVKLDVIADGDGARVELRSEIGDVVQAPAPEVTGLPKAAGDTYWLRLTRAGTSYSGSFSVDGETWTALPQPVQNTAVSDAGVGPFALGIFQESPVTASFDYVRSVDGPDPVTCEEPYVPEEGYRALFDGSAASLEGWRQAGPGGFSHVGCEIVSYGGLGLFLYEEEFEAYSLKLDWKLNGDDNSGVFVGFPDPGTDPWIAVNQGYEIQIDATDDPDSTTGAIYNAQSANLAARDAALNPVNEWNAYELVVRGETIQVILNGTLINEFTNTDPARSLQQGFIGLQNHGGTEDVAFRNVRIKELVDAPDTTAPTTTATTQPGAPDGQGGWYVSPVTVTLAATDDSGTVAGTEVRVGDGAWAAYTAPIVVDADGETVVQFRSTDAAGNVEQAGSTTVRLDRGAPSTTASIAAAPASGWHTGAVQVALAAEDAVSGVASTEWSLDGGAWTPYAGPVAVTGDGAHELRYRSTDVAGNVEEAKAATVQIDGTKPSVMVDGVARGQAYGDSGEITVSWVVSDPASGVRTSTATLDGRAVASGTTVGLWTLPLGAHALVVTAVDNAGNRTRVRVPFTTTTSTADVVALVDRFAAAGTLDARTARTLRQEVAKAQYFATLGQPARAERRMDAFLKVASDRRRVPDVAARSVLVRDGEFLRDVYRQQ